MYSIPRGRRAVALLPPPARFRRARRGGGHARCASASACSICRASANIEVERARARRRRSTGCCARACRGSGALQLAYALTPKGGVLSEFTVYRAEADRFRLFGAASAEDHDLDVLRARQRPVEPQPERASGTLVLAGPRARDVLAKLTTADLGNAAFPWLSGGHRSRRAEAAGPAHQLCRRTRLGTARRHRRSCPALRGVVRGGGGLRPRRFRTLRRGRAAAGEGLSRLEERSRNRLFAALRVARPLRRAGQGRFRRPRRAARREGARAGMAARHADARRARRRRRAGAGAGVLRRGAGRARDLGRLDSPTFSGELGARLSAAAAGGAGRAGRGRDLRRAARRDRPALAALRSRERAAEG